jgi:hypothetical protein
LVTLFRALILKSNADKPVKASQLPREREPNFSRFL